MVSAALCDGLRVAGRPLTTVCRRPAHFEVGAHREHRLYACDGHLTQVVKRALAARGPVVGVKEMVR
jgi:hypothetical protein